MAASSSSSVTTTVWQRLSRSCHEAFGWAAAFDTNTPLLVVTETLLLGMVRAHQPDSEPEVLLRHFGHTAAELERAVRLRSPQLRESPKPLSLADMPRLSTHTGQALDATLELYRQYPTTDGVVPLRHLFGGLLAVQSSVAFEVLNEVLQNVDLGAIKISYDGDFLIQPLDVNYATILNERFPQFASLDESLRERPIVSGQPALQIGRERELRMIEEALANPSRPSAVIGGPPGAGKTALAMLAASRLADRFPDGQIRVSWANDPRRRSDVIAEVESRLGLSTSGTSGLAAALSGKRILIIYDDVPLEAEMTDLLPAPPSAALIVGVSPPLVGEVIVPVGGLDPAGALALLGSVIGPDRVAAQEAMAFRLVELMGFLPANILLIGNVIRAGDATIDLVSDWLSEQKAADPAELAARAGKKFAHVFRRERAGYASDAETTGDDLDFRADAMPLCEVIMAQDVTPPLSVGLFGEWGSGKSSFMRLMRQEIDRISRESAAAKGVRDIAFCTDVRQIVFNAWHYADANLWASLVIHIFEELGSPSGPDAEARRRHDTEEQRKNLVVKLETQKQLLNEAKARQADAVKKLGAVRQALKDVVDDPIKAAINDPQVKRAEEVIKRDLGIQDVSPEKVEEIANRLAGLPGQIREGLRLLKHPKEIIPLALPIVLAAVVGLATWAIARTGFVAWVVALVLGSVGSVAGFVAGPLAFARTIAGVVSKGAQRIQQARTKAVERQAELQLKVDEAQRGLDEVEREISEIQAGHRLRKFIEDRSRSTDYLSHLGIISLIRKDFEELSRLLEDNRLARKENKDVPNKDLPSIERVILYIDDLDRCSATKVVEVLEAVHLLLAFDIFVAVVGVDPRWLVKSLERHYSTQLAAGRPGGNVGVGDEWAATPQNYLEKIFQIPFVLKPMGKSGYQALLGHHMLARPEPRPSQPAPDADGWPPQSQETAANIEATRGQTTTAVDQPLPSIDVDPDNLKVYSSELEFAKSLSPLIGTPRAAKRLINTYRLIRASLPEAEYGLLVKQNPPGDYPIVLMLLAVLIGFPNLADSVFDRLLESSPEENFWTLIASVDQSPSPGSTPGPAAKTLSKALLALRPSDNAQLPLERVRPWIRRVARYSFQTWHQGMVTASRFALGTEDT